MGYFLSIILVVALVIYVSNSKSQMAKLKKALINAETQLSRYKDSAERQSESQRETIDQLSKYQGIVDAKAEAERIKKEAIELQLLTQEKYDAEILRAANVGKIEISSAKESARSIRDKSDRLLAESHQIAKDIEQAARMHAQEIAGSALEAKENADKYQAVEKAMRNIIKGYGDEYLSPNRPIVDNLVEEYDFKDAGQKLKQTKNLIKSLLKNEQGASCEYVEEYRRKTSIEFVLDAFNGKVDSILSKTKPSNYDTLEEKIIDAYNLVNHNGQAFRNARITQTYLDATIEQLKWTVIVQKIRQEDREEQKRIKEEIKEEEKARRDYEKARKAAETEKRLLQKAVREAEQRLSSAAQEERAKYEDEIAQLRANLESALLKGERAISMAQQTKQGHVYIISNIGSFGEEVVKVGLTRRLEPMDRVKELGDASVPFAFDVHAMVFSSDVPALEKKLHKILEGHRVNRVNSRKEFFRAPISQIKQVVEESGYLVHWTTKAEAAEYRESKKLERLAKDYVAI